jgi:predicted nuclease of predicted toxin-antitoxin system
MKLLFDQNLSPRLPYLLVDLYPDSVHVRTVGLTEADDAEVWEYARR